MELRDKLKQNSFKFKDWVVAAHAYEDEKCQDIHVMFCDGLCMIRVYRNKKSNIAIISDLSVNEEVRRTGRGEFLIEYAEEIARNIFEVDFVELAVKKNTWTESWYKRLGYTYLDNEDDLNWLVKRVRENAKG